MTVAGVPREGVRRLKVRGAGVDDGTGQLLRCGLWTLAVGALAALLTKTVFGGIGEQGPHTNSGWLALIVAMMCLPFGSLLTLLGTAKWLRGHRARRSQAGPFTL